MLKLYDYYRSSACFRVRIALNLKNLNYEAITIHLLNNGGEQLSAAYQKINPHALVPALQVDDKILTQSLAIIEYLDETYPSPALLPKNSFDKARVRAFALSIAADIHPLQNSRVTKYLTNTLKITEEQKTAWYKNWIEKGLSALEKQLVSYGKNTLFCFDDEPSLADLCLVPQLFSARRFGCDVSQFPTLVRIDQHCQQHAAFIAAWPKEETV